MAAEVSGVTLADAASTGFVDAGEVVLLVGGSAGEATKAIARAAAAAAAAVVVKVTDEDSAALAGLSREHDLALLRLESDASWLQVVDLIRSVISGGSSWGGGSGGAEDLFDLAETISSIVDAPVTIEDPQSRVLAFSARQEEADEGRIATVLGRQVPAKWLDVLEERGVFKALKAGEGPIYVMDLPGDLIPRVCAPARAGQELLGSVWAPIKRPLSSRQEAAFMEAANVVALRLLRQRVTQDVDRQFRAELVRRLVAGAPRAGDAASRLHVGSGRMLVLAAQYGAVDPDATGDWDLHRLRDSLAIHLGVVDPRAAVAVVDECVYAVVPLRGSVGDGRVYSVVEALIDRLPTHQDPVIGIGREVDDYRQLAASRHDADQAVRVLRALRTRSRTTQRVVRHRDIQLDALLLILSDVIAEEATPPWDPIARLEGYDTTHGTDLLPSVSAYLESFGHVQTAARRLRTHPNTLRYRLRRAAEVSGLDLTSPDARLHAMLALRMMLLRPS